MEDFYIYIIQVSVALLVFYVLYRMLFARDTFLELRRLFLLTAVALAFSHPLITLSSLAVPKEVFQPIIGYADMLTVTAAVVVPVREAPVYTWQNLVMVVWIGGMLVLTVRMLVQLFAVCRLAAKGRRMQWQGVKVIALQPEVAPFSFFGWIFVCPACHNEKELNEIIAHEQTHVRQWHSLDMVLGELLCIFLWFNPVVWLLRREIRQNLEFLADKQVVRAGYNPKNYQYHLLRLSHQSTAVQIVNNFNVSSLKKRIIMMNKKRTSRIGLMKYALLIPVTGLLILAGNAQAVAERIRQYSTDQTQAEPAPEQQAVQAQANEERHIKGRIVDEDGKPITGASIVVVGTWQGSVSDGKGNFSVNVGDMETGKLSFSYVGKKTQSLVFDRSTKELKVKLVTDVMYLDLISVVGFVPDKKKSLTGPKDDEEIFVVVEDMPRFKEGSVLKYLARQVRYPVRAQEKGIVGKVFVSFVIDKNGHVTQAEVIRSVSEELDREALRVINSMPDWIPGKQRGKPVDVKYVLPIEFSLVQEPEKKVMLNNVHADSITVTNENHQFQITSKGSPQGTAKDVTPQEALKVVTAAGQPKPVCIVDGKKMPANFDANSIPLNKVKSVTVLKAVSAMKVYGEVGKNGVVVIVTENPEKTTPEETIVTGYYVGRNAGAN